MTGARSTTFPVPVSAVGAPVTTVDAVVPTHEIEPPRVPPPDGVKRTGTLTVAPEAIATTPPATAGKNAKSVAFTPLIVQVAEPAVALVLAKTRFCVAVGVPTLDAPNGRVAGDWVTFDVAAGGVIVIEPLTIAQSTLTAAGVAHAAVGDGRVKG